MSKRCFCIWPGSVEQKRRRAEIIAFRNDPNCRLFLSTDSGGVGLNLQNASIVINCDLPWNPARLEQRIARAWRKGQLRPVTVINLVAEQTIEHGMVGTLAEKSRLAEGVLDGGDLKNVGLKGGRQAFLKRLEQVMAAVPANQTTPPKVISDPAAHFARCAREKLGERLLHCEESYAPGADQPVLFAILANGASTEDRSFVQELHHQSGWPAKATPDLHILDSAAWEAMQALAAAGFITIHTRARRPLLVPDNQPTLSPRAIGGNSPTA